MGEIFWLCYRWDSARVHISDSKTVVSNGPTTNATSKTTVAVVSLLDYIRKQQVAPIKKKRIAEIICPAAIEESIQGDREINT